MTEQKQLVVNPEHVVAKVSKESFRVYLMRCEEMYTTWCTPEQWEGLDTIGRAVFRCAEVEAQRRDVLLELLSATSPHVDALSRGAVKDIVPMTAAEIEEYDISDERINDRLLAFFLCMATRCNGVLDWIDGALADRRGEGAPEGPGDPPGGRSHFTETLRTSIVPLYLSGSSPCYQMTESARACLAEYAYHDIAVDKVRYAADCEVGSAPGVIEERWRQQTVVRIPGRN